MCDGYYFPISASVPRRQFHRDASQCRSQCGTEARLFYHSSSSGDAAAMIDVTGRAYAKLPNAFRYRKTLVDGCKCKPEPWAESELDRHQGYAMAEAAKSSTAPAPVVPSTRVAAEVVAGHGRTPVALGSAASPEQTAPHVVSVMVAGPVAKAPASPVHAGDVADVMAPLETSEARKADPVASLAALAAISTPRKPVQKTGIRRVGQSANRAAVGRPPRPASKPTVVAAPRQKQAPAGIFGLGGQKLKWPGD